MTKQQDQIRDHSHSLLTADDSADFGQHQIRSSPGLQGIIRIQNLIVGK